MTSSKHYSLHYTMISITKMALTILVTGLVFLFSSCSETISQDTHKFSNENWNYSDSIQFSIEINENETPLDMFLLLRNTSGYDYSNIYIQVDLLSPTHKKLVSERMEFVLADKSGRWTGTGAANLFTNKLQIVYQSAFKEKGEYTLNLKHYMRNDELIGIRDIGYVLDYSDSFE
jgi:gliding motility-associated lipoprotein GldH